LQWTNWVWKVAEGLLIAVFDYIIRHCLLLQLLVAVVAEAAALVNVVPKQRIHTWADCTWKVAERPIIAVMDRPVVQHCLWRLLVVGVLVAAATIVVSSCCKRTSIHWISTYS
jgi:hypothetical protein